MLVRTFRLTDKLSNALLKLAIFATYLLMQRIYGLRRALETTATTLIMTGVAGGRSLYRVLTVRGRRAANAAEERRQRLQAAMAQRAAQAQTSPQADSRALQVQEVQVIEDPLISRNRTLSAISVVLLLALIGVIVWATGESGESGGASSLLNSDAAAIIPTNPVEEERPVIPTPTPTATSATNTLSNVSGTLVFTIRQNGQDDIWALPVGSNQPVRLTDSLADDRHPAWSPDGTRIAYASRREGFWDLYVLNLVTGNLQQLTNTRGYEGYPTWSPDGAFIAYEGYSTEDANIDIYIIPSDGGGGSQRLTFDPFPDLEPAWRPGEGREIAYVGWRDGNQELLVLSLDNPSEEAAVNLSNTSDVNESHPVWSPEGRRLAYTADENNIEGIYVRPFGEASGLGGGARLVGRGRMPTWNPVDGASVFYTVPQPLNSALYLGQVDSFGVGANAVAFQGAVSDLDWSSKSLDDFSSAPDFPVQTPPLYQERVDISTDGTVGLQPISNLDIPNPLLSDRVNDSYDALRRRVAERVGYDLMSDVEDLLWLLNRRPEPGEPRQSWHYTGRAFSLNRNLALDGTPPPIVVLREDTEFGTAWRVMARVASGGQDGTLGEPLRAVPWDFSARFEDDPQAFTNGGRYAQSVPPGYYVDLTQLFSDFGWERVLADSSWRTNYSGVLYWQFEKRETLNWETAMLELYPEDQLSNFVSGDFSLPPTPIPTATPTPQATPASQATASEAETPTPEETP